MSLLTDLFPRAIKGEPVSRQAEAPALLQELSSSRVCGMQDYVN